MSLAILASCKNRGSRFNNVPDTDTTCVKELKKAQKELGEGRLVYCHYAGNILFSPLRSEKQMRRLLNGYKIEYKNETSSCIVYSGQTEHCYCGVMREKIEEKFGQNFLDSLLEISDSLYAFGNPLDTFHYSQCDTWPRFPNENEDMEYSYILQGIFDKRVNYPEEYVLKEHRDTAAFVDVGFVVDKAGKASNIEYWFIFDHDENKRFKDYFMEVIEPLITAIRWQPATLKKKAVISDMNIRIQLE